MILIDSRVGSRELAPYISKNSIKIELCTLPFGDFAFTGNGPKGPISVGIERSTIHDFLHKIDDARYAGHQRIGMSQLYGSSILIIEGHWKPHEDGWLMEGFNGGNSWGYCKYRSKYTLYSKLRRYLFSVSLSGVTVLYTRDIFHTAYDICELYHWYQKKWNNHTALLEVQKPNIPSLSGKPSLARRWAHAITDIGVKISEDAERLFKNGKALGNSSEADWLKLPGVGETTAKKIVREIRGIK